MSKRIKVIPSMDLSHPRIHVPFEDDDLKPDLTTIAMFRSTAAKYPTCTMLRWRAGMATNPEDASDVYESMTYEDAVIQVERIAASFTHMGLKRGSSVGIYARNSPLWILVDLACASCGLVVVPIYDTLGSINIHYVAELTHLEIIVTQGCYLHTVLGMAGRLPDLRSVILLDSLPNIGVLKTAAVKVQAELGGDEAEQSEYARSEMSIFSIGDRSHISAADVTTSRAREGEEAPDAAPETPSTAAATAEAAVSRLRPFHEMLPAPLPPASPSNPLFLLSLAQMTEQAPPFAGDVDITPDDPITMIFTSGSTGNPKGVVHSSRSLQSGAMFMSKRIYPKHASRDGTPHVFISFLPLAHVYERDMEYLSIARGHEIVYYCGSTKMLINDFQMAKPTIVAGVPRVFVKIYDAVQQQLAASAVKRHAFNTAMTLKRNYVRFVPGASQSLKMPLVDVVFKQLKQKMGGRVEAIMSGSASLPFEVVDFLRLAVGAQLTMGYGSTETSSCGAATMPMFKPERGYLGYPCAGLEAAILERAEVGRGTLEDGVGELLLRGPMNALCYHPPAPVTDEEGYYHTGDMVKWRAKDNTMVYVSRATNVVKLQHGEFVDIEQLESVIGSSPLFSQVFVHAECDKAFPVAVVYPNQNALDHRLSAMPEDDPGRDIEQVCIKEGRALCKRAGLKGFMVPRAFVISDVEWTAQNGLFSPAMKPRRGELRKYFKVELISAFARSGGKAATMTLDADDTTSWWNHAKQIRLLIVILSVSIVSVILTLLGVF